MGTSISTRHSRSKNSRAATVKVGAIGTVRRSRLDGRCVKTIVRRRPIRRASQAAAKCEAPFAIRASKNKGASVSSPTPNLLKNQ